MPQRGNFFHLHLVSDATGETLITVARAAAAQYATVAPIEHIYPLIRTEKQISRVFEDIELEPGIVLYTLVDQNLAHMIDQRIAFVLGALEHHPTLVREQLLRGVQDLHQAGSSAHCAELPEALAQPVDRHQEIGQQHQPRMPW